QPRAAGRVVRGRVPATPGRGDPLEGRVDGRHTPSPCGRVQSEAAEHDVFAVLALPERTLGQVEVAPADGGGMVGQLAGVDAQRTFGLETPGPGFCCRFEDRLVDEPQLVLALTRHRHVRSPVWS